MGNIYSLISRLKDRKSSMLEILSQISLTSAEVTKLRASFRRTSSSQSVTVSIQNGSNVDRYARASLR